MIEALIWNTLLLILALGSMGIAAWSLLSGQVAKYGFDGTFLFLVSLLLTAIFAIPPVRAWRAGLLSDALSGFARLLKERSRKMKIDRAGGRGAVPVARRPCAAA